MSKPRRRPRLIEFPKTIATAPAPNATIPDPHVAAVLATITDPHMAAAVAKMLAVAPRLALLFMQHPIAFAAVEQLVENLLKQTPVQSGSAAR